ncbi:hypothetical protein CVT24_012812 [Panaeolus cyanescens]|uniref:Uncharacterized protein n=1 Tax=Panaeolus cyanescens TaxID=181874 RepID=A0A409X4M1_9AGAR|nr:hypothetical protein CVT24_012812 [Panaeolus cyanescens]
MSLVHFTPLSYSYIPGSHFDHKTKTWLVLWEAGVIIELPPWVAAIYPSSLFIHFNVDISDLKIVVTQDGELPTPLNSSPLGDDDGRASMVFFNQATMYQSSETGYDTLIMAREHGHTGTTNYGEDAQRAFVHILKKSNDPISKAMKEHLQIDPFNTSPSNLSPSTAHQLCSMMTARHVIDAMDAATNGWKDEVEDKTEYTEIVAFNKQWNLLLQDWVKVIEKLDTIFRKSTNTFSDTPFSGGNTPISGDNSSLQHSLDSHFSNLIHLANGDKLIRSLLNIQIVVTHLAYLLNTDFTKYGAMPDWEDEFASRWQNPDAPGWLRKLTPRDFRFPLQAATHITPICLLSSSVLAFPGATLDRVVLMQASGFDCISVRDIT